MNRRKSAIALALGSFALIATLAPAPQAPAEGDNPKDLAQALKLITLAQARAGVARKIADFYVDRRLGPPDRKSDLESIPGSEQVEFWTRKYVDAKLETANGAEERIAILTEDFDRTKAIEARIRELVENDPAFAKLDAFKAEFYRLDAECRLTKEKLGR